MEAICLGRRWRRSPYLHFRTQARTSNFQANMVCSKCQKKLKSTELATPGVKRKNELYYGSPSSTLGGGDKGKKATLGATGIGKVSSRLDLLEIWVFQSDLSRIN